MSAAEWLNMALMAAGGIVLVWALCVVMARRAWRSALAMMPVRSRQLDVVHTAIILLFFLVVLGGMTQLGSAIEPPTGLSEHQWIGDATEPGLWPILANNIAKLATAIVACLTVVLVVDGGLSAIGLRSRRPGRDLVWAVLTYLVVWPVCAGIAQVSILLTGRPPTHGVLILLQSGGLPTWAAVTLWASAVLVSPLAEEVFFRGILQTVIRGYVDRPWLAIAVASILFGLMHHHQPQYVLPLALLGLALGYVYEHTGSLVAPILIHILFNSRTMLLDWLLRAS